jgi:thiol-disulfide isomerase/thioredoxin
MLAGLALAAVFATAAVAKLVDLEGSRRAVAAFGLPRRLATALGTLLPAAELATAALLIVGAARGGGALLAGAVSALALLTIFCVGIALSLVRGRAPECHCFGQLHSAPASGRTLARNGALLSVAAFVASGGDPLLAGEAGVAALTTLGVVLLLTRNHAGERAQQMIPEGLPLGSRAPDFELAALDGPPISLGGLLQPGRPVLLVFTDAGCGPCIALAPEIAKWQREHAGDLTIAVIENGDSRRETAPDEHGRRNMLLQSDGEVSNAYRAEGTPSAILVGADGRVASGVAAGGPAIEALLARTLPRYEPRGASDAAAPGTTPLVRRELLVRAAAAWAAATGLITSPAWGSVLTAERKCRYERCGDRCCPRKAKCRQRGERRVCICPDGRRACRDRCCPETFVCRRRGRRRRCVCPDGYIICSGRCVRIRTDPSHCGRCGRQCPRGTACVDGGCVGGDGSGTGPGGSGACNCPRGQTCCEGRCTDLNTSEEHCGECGQTCVEGKACCEGHCRNLENDPRNCGRCGKRCASEEVCSDGECRRRCRRGLTGCKGSCVDTKSDRSNCGRCGSKCSGPFDTGVCCNGKCCDYNASTCCPGGCKNLALDGDNCGECGNVCPPNSYCRFGTCSGPI